MKKLLILIGFAAMLGIFSCGSDDVSDPKGPSPKVTVTGNVYNQAVLAALSVPVGQRELSGALTPNSILNATAPNVASLTRFNDVSQDTLVTVDILVENKGAVDLSNLSYEVGIEEKAFLTREYWSCLECFDLFSGDGSICGSHIWDVQGGYFYNTVTPALPACDTSPGTGVCYDTFPADVDCEAQYFNIDYNGPGSGLQMTYGSIPALPSGKTFATSSGYSHSAADIRSNHLAWFSVKDSKDNVLAEKYYAFDVMP